MTIENQNDLVGLMRIGKIVAQTIQHMIDSIEPGMTTKELDDIGAAFLTKHGARSAPILAYKFPGYTCISINDEAAHGIPGDKVIQPGDLVNVDVSAELDGYWADSGRSMQVPPHDPEKQRMIAASKEALEIAIEYARGGNRIFEIGKAVEAFASKKGYSVIRELGGHGVGRHIHEKPSVPHHYNRRANQRLVPGTVLTLEPFLTTGAKHIYTEDDGWTLRTTDGSLVVQHEHTVVITEDRPIIVTAL
ncbi:MAG: type I methionyl aminopeptidase [Aggregatilineales bacterium]